jgi:hypothetical protein
MGQALNAEYKTELMTTETIERYWPFIERELDTVPHIWNMWFTKEALYLGALNGEFSVWGVGPSDQIRLVVFTRIIEYTVGRCLQVFLAFGGDMRNCLPALEGALEQLANKTGCMRCEVIGRPGWEKLLPNFKRTSVVLMRELEPFKVQ